MPLSEQEELELLRLRQRKAQAAAAPAPTRGGYYADVTKKGIANLGAAPGLAVDAMNALLGGAEKIIRPGISDPVFPVDDPVYGTEDLRRRFSGLLGVEDIEAPTIPDKAAGLAIEMGIPSIPLMGRNIATAPHKTAATAAEVGSLLGSSLGGVAGEEIGGALGGEEGAQTGEMLGVLGGGAVPLTIPSLLSRGGGWAAARLSPTARKEAARRETSRVLGSAMESELDIPANVELADESARRLQEFGEFSPTLGARTGGDVVPQLEHEIAAHSPKNLGRYSRQKDINEQTLEAAKGELLGEQKATGLPRQASSRLVNARKQIDTKLAQMEAQSKRLAESVTGETQPAGEKLRDQYWKLRDSAKQDINKSERLLYRAADESGVSVDMADVGEFVADVAKADKNVYQDMPTTYGKVRSIMERDADQALGEGWILPDDVSLQAGAAQPGQATFQEFHSLWKEINREYGIAQRAGDSQRIHYLQQLKDVVKSKLDDMEAGGLGAVSDEFRAFNRQYQRYAKTFKEGIGGRVADVGRFGASLDDANVVQRFLTPDGMDDFIAIYGDDPQAQQFLKDGILGMFSKSAIDETTNRIKPGSSESFIRRHGEALKKVPDVEALLRDTDAANRALIERSARLSQARKQMDSTVLAEVAQSENVDNVIRSAAKSPRKMRQLFAMAKTPEQRQAVARTFADNLPEIAAANKMEPYEYLMANEESFRPILNQLGPKHWDNVKLIASGETMQQRMQVPGRVAKVKPEEEIYELTGSNARSIIATYVNLLRGRSQPHGEIAQLMARMGIKKRADLIGEILDEAIYDPDLASELVAEMRTGSRSATKAKSNKLANNIETLLFRTVITSDMPGREQEEAAPEPKPDRRQASQSLLETGP